MHRHRQIAARQLVFALRAGLDPGQALRDRPVDGLIIAQLEMQEGMILDAAPVAAVKRLAPDEVQRPGDRLAPRSASTSSMSSRIVAWSSSKARRVR